MIYCNARFRRAALLVIDRITGNNFRLSEHLLRQACNEALCLTRLTENPQPDKTQWFSENKTALTSPKTDKPPTACRFFYLIPKKKCVFFLTKNKK